jgi:hypothetical protein
MLTQEYHWDLKLKLKLKLNRIESNRIVSFFICQSGFARYRVCDCTKAFSQSFCQRALKCSDLMFMHLRWGEDIPRLDQIHIHIVLQPISLRIDIPYRPNQLSTQINAHSMHNESQDPRCGTCKQRCRVPEDIFRPGDMARWEDLGCLELHFRVHLTDPFQITDKWIHVRAWVHASKSFKSRDQMIRHDSFHHTVIFSSSPIGTPPSGIALSSSVSEHSWSAKSRVSVKTTCSVGKAQRAVLPRPATGKTFWHRGWAHSHGRCRAASLQRSRLPS